MSEENSFRNLYLHDGFISSIEIYWESKTCIIKLAAFLDKGQDAVDCTLQFDGVSNVNVPHKAPWGDSVFINEQHENDAEGYVIEMQSGDEIRITAKSFKLVRINAAA